MKKTMKRKYIHKKTKVKRGGTINITNGEYVGRGAYSVTETEFLRKLKIRFTRPGPATPPLDDVYTKPTEHNYLFNMSLIEAIFRLNERELSDALRLIDRSIQQRIENMTHFTSQLIPYNSSDEGKRHGDYYAKLCSVFQLIRGVLKGVNIDTLCSFQPEIILLYTEEFEAIYESKLAERKIEQFKEPLAQQIKELKENIATFKIQVSNQTQSVLRLNQYTQEYTTLTQQLEPLTNEHCSRIKELLKKVTSNRSKPPPKVLQTASKLIKRLDSIPEDSVALYTPSLTMLDDPSVLKNILISEVESKMSVYFYKSKTVDKLILDQLNSVHKMLL